MNRRIALTLSVICGLLGTAGPSAGETGPSPALLEPVTVTAERFPVEERDSPRFVTVVTAEELRRTGADNVAEALRRVGGLGYKAFSPIGVTHGGMNSEVVVRGIYGGELVLVNGVPIQNPASRSYDIDTIPLDQVERVEILKGAASTLYGSDAMTGVINIITRPTTRQTRARASVEFGDYAYQSHGASFTNRLVAAGVQYRHMGRLKAISRSFSKGYRYDQDTTNRYSGNLTLTPFDGLTVDLLGSYDTTGFKKIKDDGTLSKGTDQEYYRFTGDLRWEREALRAKAFHNWGYLLRDEYTKASKPTDKDKHANSGVTADYRFAAGPVEVTVGGEAVHRWVNYLNKYGAHQRNDYALFLQAKATLAERLILVLGAREQWIYFDGAGDDYAELVPSAGATLRLTRALNLFANAGKAFRAPTFNNLYYESSFLVGNPELDPEEGWTYEVGLKLDTERAALRLAAFRMDYTDKIEIDRSQGYPLTYFNAGTFESTGIEWNLLLAPFAGRGDLLGRFSLAWAGYWANPVAEDTNDNPYQSGPKHQSSVTLSYDGDRCRADVSTVLQTGRERNLDDVTTVNAGVKVRLYKGSLTLAVDNLLDQEVEVSGDKTATAANRYLYYGLPRLFRVGYEVAF